MSSQAIEQVVQALQTLYHTNQNASEREKANEWLGEFQKSDEAWSTAQLILFAQDAPLETKLFAAQTFRTKITYDLEKLPQAQRTPLRDSLLSAMKSFANGPRVVLTHICIALADLALQMPTSEWNDPVSYMIELFGKDPAMANALLEFLQVIVEEYAGNTRIPVYNDFGRPPIDSEQTNGHVPHSSSQQAEQVVGLLSMYVSAPGITDSLKNHCFSCMGAWLREGQAPATILSGKAILSAAFDGLAHDQLFDSAVDLVVDLIHETQEIDDNVAAIQEIVPRLVTLRQLLAQPSVKEDEDKMRGLCRIFVEAGEWYVPLILQHQQTFSPIVEAIGECAACDNLDIVNITLDFWFRLAQALRRSESKNAYQPLLAVYSELINVIIRHLHYPPDDAPLVGQELDDFKSFRYRIGDTLKDCCSILGTTHCLQRSYDTIAAVIQSGNVRWQDVEAPLFSMRSMGAEVSPNDEEILPRIMDLMPTLPAHPKIRYAATLVIGRYTPWINVHPDRIGFVLTYISAGFEDGDIAVSAAAAQALKYLCKDCSTHLVPYLPQLHSFMSTVSNRLTPADKLDMAAAIAHIISSMPAETAPQALSTFVMPEVQVLHKLAESPQQAGKAEITEAKAALERIDQYLEIVQRWEQGLPAECAGICQQVWSVFDALIARYGGDVGMSERICTVIRRGLQFFGDDAFAVAPAVLDRMAGTFETHPLAGYLWITSKLVAYFSHLNDQAFMARVAQAFERETNKVFSLLQTAPSPSQQSDELDDFSHLVADMAEYAPSIVFNSPAFPAALQCVTAATTLAFPNIVMAALDTLREIIGHESLAPNPSTPAAFVAFAPVIKSTVATIAPQLVPTLIQTLVDGIEDASSSILTILRLMAVDFEQQLVQAVPSAVQALPPKYMSEQDKAQFMTKFGEAVSAHDPNKVKAAFTWLLRTSRKSLDRANAMNRQRQQ